MSKKNGNKAEEKIPTAQGTFENVSPPKKLTNQEKVLLESTCESAMERFGRRESKEHWLPTRFSTLARSSNTAMKSIKYFNSPWLFSFIWYFLN